MPTVLIVCTGNLCRSPMAAALLRARLARDEARWDWQVSSAGTWATDGLPASVHAVEEMAGRGIDLRAHRARNVTRELMAGADLILAMARNHAEALRAAFPVTRELMAGADLILAMARNHAEALRAAFPEHAPKVYLLSEMVGQKYDIYDPYGGTPMEYAYIARELEQLVEAGYERIVALVERAPGG